MAEPTSITVYAAASLTVPFTEIGQKFEAENEGVTVNFSFSGSSTLAAQLTEGAPADVFASADQKNMATVVDAGLIGETVDFATNTLTIVTEPGNPKGIASLADLANPDLLVVTCAPQVPCGSAAAKVQEGAGVTLTPVSEEQAVTDVLTKVVTGQADAGLVYVSDAATAGDTVAEVPFPESATAVNVYPIGLLSESENSAQAQAFVDFVTGPVGSGVLLKSGLKAP
jgi:molybdate transport system substrate-binding protein